MTVTTVFATAPGGNGSGQGVNATYATARSTYLTGAANHQVGQAHNGASYFCYEAVAIFDTSGITDTDVASDVVLSLDGNSNQSTTDFTVVAASSPYNGGAYASGDWIAGASLTGQTTYATWDTSGYSANYNAFTSAGADFNNAINLTGNTALMVYSDRHAAGTAPGSSTVEYVIFTDADAAGTTSDPKLDITHAGSSAVKDMISGYIPFAR